MAAGRAGAGGAPLPAWRRRAGPAALALFAALSLMSGPAARPAAAAPVAGAPAPAGSLAPAGPAAAPAASLAVTPAPSATGRPAEGVAGSRRRHGLPVVLAAVAVIGFGSLLLRLLLAHPAARRSRLSRRRW